MNTKIRNTKFKASAYTLVIAFFTCVTVQAQSQSLTLKDAINYALENKADAKKAMEELDGKDIEGRALSVTVARPKEQRSGGGGGSFSQNRKRW